MNNTKEDGAAPTTAVLGNCLHHGEYHLMQAECWSATVEFWLQWQADEPGISGSQLKTRYDNEVERKMLDNLLRELNPGNKT